MAEQLPNLYTFGQVKVDTSSLADLQGKLFAKEQATQEALNKYFEKQMSSLSKEGLYEEDVKPYEKRIEKLKTKWNENKQNILKGGQAKSDFDNEVESIKDFIYKSKENKKNLVEAYKLQREGKLGTVDDVEVIKAMETSQDDPRGYKPDGTRYGWKDFSEYVPAFDDKKRSEYFNTIQGYTSDPAATGKVVKKRNAAGDIEEFSEMKYSKGQLKEMIDGAMISLPSSKIPYTYYQQLKRNPTDPRFVKLKEVWDNSKLYPGDEMDTPEDLAKADIIREFFERVIERPSKTINIPQRSSAPKGAGDKWTDYYFLGDYSPVAIGKTGQKGILARNLTPRHQNVIEKLNLKPIYDSETQEYWYFYKEPGKWVAQGRAGQTVVTEDDVAEADAPADVKRKQKAGRKKTGASGLN